MKVLALAMETQAAPFVSLWAEAVCLVSAVYTVSRTVGLSQRQEAGLREEREGTLV